MENIKIVDKSKYLMSKDSGYHIYAFMRNDLNLAGHELTVYAVIYGFSMGGHGCFYGSREYLSACTGASLPTIDRTLKSLVEKELVNKTSSITNKGITPNYSVNMEKIKEIQNKKNELSKIECSQYNKGVYQNDKGVYQNDKGVYQNDKGVYQNDKQYNSNIEENIEMSAWEALPKNVNSQTNTHTPNIPSLEQCQEYAKEQNYELDIERFYNYYESIGWCIKGSPIINWKSLLTNWVKNRYSNSKQKNEINICSTYCDTPIYDF